MKLHKSSRMRMRRAFSLFEAIICVVVLGVIGIICNSILLDMSKTLTMQRKLSEPTYTIALLKIENLLQSAFPQSLIITPQNSELVFTRLDVQTLSGGGDKNSSLNFFQNTLLPPIELSISSIHNSTLTMTHTNGWHLDSEIMLFPSQNQIYTIKAIAPKNLTLNAPPAQNSTFALPVKSHRIWLSKNTLWLNNEPLAFNISSFLALPHTMPNNETFLELRLCVQSSIKEICQKGGVWITNPIEYIL